MKQFKLVLVALAAMVLVSCEEGESEIEQTLVVEQVNINGGDIDKDCDQCGLKNQYKYKIKIKSNSGETYYFTDYKHEVGDTLLSSKMFVQQEVEDRAALKNEVARLQKVNDSLVEANNTMKFQYDLMVDFYEKNVINKKNP
jgi:hypothetical protein